MFKSMELDIFHKIKAEKELNSEKIIKFMNDRLSSITNNYKVLDESKTKLRIRGTILGTMKILGIDVNLNVTSEGNSAKLRIVGKQFNGPFFWVLWSCLIIIGFIFIGGGGFVGTIITLIYLFVFTRFMKSFASKPKELLEKVVKEADIEFS